MQPTCICTGVSSLPPQRRHGCARTVMPKSGSFRVRSLRCTGLWRSLASSAWWLVAAAVRSRAWT